MNPNYKKHVFVCDNQRESINKKSCGEIGSMIRTNLKKEIVVIGLGYVGLPLAVNLSEKFSVIGFDISIKS